MAVIRLGSLLAITAVVSCLVIDPDEEEFVIPSGADLTLSCRDDYSDVFWNLPELNEEEPGRIQDVARVSKDGLYSRDLFIHRAKFMDTGFYTCETESGENERKIYIYVRDARNLIVAEYSTEVISLPPNQREFIIPCKPTSPDVNLTLVYDNGMEVDEDEATPVAIDYHPQFGFHVSNFSLEGTYLCSAISSDHHQNITFVIKYHESGDLEVPRVELLKEESVNSHVVVGDNVELQCTVTASLANRIHLHWETTEAQRMNKRIIQRDLVRKKMRNGKPINEGSSILTINNVMVEDSGVYVCANEGHFDKKTAEYNLTVYSANASFLNIGVEGNSTIYVRAGKPEAIWIVNILAHPVPQLHWVNPQGEIMNAMPSYSKYTKYVIENGLSTSKVIVRDLNITDSGHYVLKATNKAGSKNITVNLVVEGEPLVRIVNTKPIYLKNEEIILECSVMAYPPPRVTMSFKECATNRICEDPVLPEKSLPVVGVGCKNVSCIYTTKFKALRNGRITCTASNPLHTNLNYDFIHVTDVPGEFRLIKEPIVGPISDMDPVTLKCGAVKFKYSDSIQWIYTDNSGNSTQIDSSFLSEKSMEIQAKNTDVSYWSQLYIPRPQLSYSGRYTCRTKNIVLNTTEERNEELLIVESQPPIALDKSSKDNTVQLDLGESVTWNCNVTGIPMPTIIWYKKNKVVHPDRNSSRIKLYHGNKTLKIVFATPEDEGKYFCKAENKKGTTFLHYKLILNHPMRWEWAVISSFLIIVLICLGAVFFLVKKVRREKKLRQELNAAGLYYFQEGQVASINPDLDIGEQAELLPYDKKWEFPREKLKLGMQLGSGAFGVVMKAEAYGIADEGCTTVAVKMVKKNSDLIRIKALASELKIMAHLGRHLNVVNLLGACTANLTNRELLVIVEYCEFGNLHNYLLRHRDTFIDQVNSSSAYVPSKDSLRGANSDGSGTYKLNSVYDTRGSNGNSVTGESTPSAQTAPAATPVGDDGYLLNIDQSIHYKPVSTISSGKRTLCTQDLFCWGYQVAKGMEYLASRKVLHGDLATRNILLARDNIVKICDFGLAKSMYQDDIYTKKTKDLLPVKWMSIEAVRDRMFSTQSDVWAYGVVLWELFSLAKSPYPGMRFDKTLFDMLLDGYRMEKPHYATDDVYNLMLECWKEQPMLRPTFTECAERLGSMLEERVKQQYIDLNNSYALFNSELNSQRDYLSMLKPPTYANCIASEVTDTPSEAGYLPMKKTNDKVRDGSEIEMMPMLPVPGQNIIINPGYEGLDKVLENARNLCISRI